MSDAGRPPFRILTVCTHNRTRSVMIEAMLRSLLIGRLGDGRVEVDSVGFGPPDQPPIPDAVAAMAARGLDIADHRSRQPTDADLAADLVLTAERDHVIRLAMMSRTVFPRSMTLPEFLARSESPATHGELDPHAWIAMMTESRSPADYLRQQIPEISDPTGSPRRVFEAAVEDMFESCVRAADGIARRLT